MMVNGGIVVAAVPTARRFLISQRIALNCAMIHYSERSFRDHPYGFAFSGDLGKLKTQIIFRLSIGQTSNLVKMHPVCLNNFSRDFVAQNIPYQLSLDNSIRKTCVITYYIFI